MTDPKYLNIMNQYNLPPIDGDVVKMRWLAKNNDWFVKTEAGWFWLEPDTRQWRPSNFGPDY